MGRLAEVRLSDTTNVTQQSSLARSYATSASVSWEWNVHFRDRLQERSATMHAQRQFCAGGIGCDTTDTGLAQRGAYDSCDLARAACAARRGHDEEYTNHEDRARSTTTNWQRPRVGRPPPETRFHRVRSCR